MSWYWKEIADKRWRRGCHQGGGWNQLLHCCADGLLAVLSIVYHQPILGVNAWSLVDSALFVLIAWRIRKMSRTWAVVGICLYVLEAISSVGSRRGGIGVLTIVFILAYVNALRGTFAYPRYVEQLREASDTPENLNASAG
jgi:hypothetical protein